METVSLTYTMFPITEGFKCHFFKQCYQQCIKINGGIVTEARTCCQFLHSNALPTALFWPLKHYMVDKFYPIRIIVTNLSDNHPPGMPSNIQPQKNEDNNVDLVVTSQSSSPLWSERLHFQYTITIEHIKGYHEIYYKNRSTSFKVI